MAVKLAHLELDFILKKKKVKLSKNSFVEHKKFLGRNGNVSKVKFLNIT